MGQAAFLGLVGLTLLLGAIFGVVTVLVLAKTQIARAAAFGWGAVFGPVGIAVAATIAVRHARRTAEVKSGSADSIEDPPW